MPAKDFNIQEVVVVDDDDNFVEEIKDILSC